MRMSRWVGSALAVSAVFCLAMAGCSGGGKPSSPNAKNTGDGSGTKTNTVKAGPVEGKGVATIKGRVTYDGTPPKGANLLAQIEGNEDKTHCLKDPTKDSQTDLTWKVSGDGGVANVAIWLRPQKGQYFKPVGKQEPAMVDQPFCAFEPHVSIIHPKYRDGKKLAPTGQKFVIKNSAPIAHNTKYNGNKVKNISGNLNIASGQEIPIEIPPDYSTVVALNCDRHKWMKGYIWSLETPYYAVTDKDGNFEIKNVPAGVDLQLVAWHEQPGFFLPGGSRGDTISVMEGDNTKDLKVKAK